jgi:hypothetical protein
MGMTITMLAASAMTVLAEDAPVNTYPTEGNALITKSGKSADAPITLTATKSQLNVTVPTVLPITMDAYGRVTTATNAAITNNSYGPICVESATITALNGWSLVAADADLTSNPLGTKNLGFGLQITGSANASAGTQTASTTATGGNEQKFFNADGAKLLVINGTKMNASTTTDSAAVGTLVNPKKLNITYNAVVSPQKVKSTNTQIAKVSFVVKWNEVESSTGSQTQPEGNNE